MRQRERLAAGGAGRVGIRLGIVGREWVAHSPKYAEAARLREAYADSDLVIVEGAA